MAMVEMPLQGIVLEVSCPIPYHRPRFHPPCLTRNSHIGTWMRDQAAILEFMKLSPEMRSFVCSPVNQPYLELARNLSQLSADRLRAVAEALFDITL